VLQLEADRRLLRGVGLRQVRGLEGQPWLRWGLILLLLVLALERRVLGGGECRRQVSAATAADLEHCEIAVRTARKSTTAELGARRTLGGCTRRRASSLRREGREDGGMGSGRRVLRGVGVRRVWGFEGQP